jgi:hypothetical protein
MGTIKIATWNIEHLDHLIKDGISNTLIKRRDAIIQEIRELSADILCVVEGPKGEDAIYAISTELLGGDWKAVLAPDHNYATKGAQWIWFLVKKELYNQASLLPLSTWDTYAGKSWKVHYWGVFEEENHAHYRHPQVLVINWNGFRVEIIGVHCKSKFVNQGKNMWESGGDDQKGFILEALKARIKMTTEVTNIRSYISARFNQTEKPAIFVLGDFNDGPGKEYFENLYLFFDLISNVQGDIFSSDKYLNHALFDFADHLRWTVSFKDFIDPYRDPNILLDHIFFTQGLIDDSLPWKIDEHAGKVEHEIHDLINSTLPKAANTSDHKPVSVIVTTK